MRKGRVLFKFFKLVLLLALVTALSLAGTGLVYSLQPNAYEDTYYAELPLKVARLEETAGSRVVVIGGSSVAFGIDSKLAEQELIKADMKLLEAGVWNGGAKEDVKERYEAALELASRKHAGQTRIGGDPYITHPMAAAGIVRSWGCGIDYQIAALFHDLLEDTDASEEEIEAIGGRDVLTAVRLLTKQPGYVMAEYVASIRQNPIARTVKAADRLHNLRCAVVAPTAFKRRYIIESLEWYLDFCPEIPEAVRALAESIDPPAEEFAFLSGPAENWPVHRTE